jgi:carbamoyltransferase
MIILGLNAFHGDSAACIYKNGVLIAATEEERIRRQKHWAGLPTESIKFCLHEAGITLRDVDYITISRDPMAKFNEKVKHVLSNFLTLKSLKSRAQNSVKVKNLKKEIADRLGFDVRSVKAQIHYVEHHRSHMASAFLVSPFDECAILSIDGFGDFTSTMRGIGQGNKIKVLDSVSYPHSLGIFYSTFTQLLGFPYYGDEYKVMGLAPYGHPKYVEEVHRSIILKPNGLFELNPKYFRHFKEGVELSWEGGDPHVGVLYSDYMISVFGNARAKDAPLTEFHKDLAASVQKVCEEVVFYMLKDLHDKTKMDNVCITGGVAQNSVCNGKITTFTPFKNAFVPPAGHDAGTSIGSALYLQHHTLNMPRSVFKNQAYTGAQYDNKSIIAFLESHGISFEEIEDDTLYDVVTDCLIDGGVVGWFQGRAEFGPRALGNRSILVDPRRADAKDILNQKIKRRESFRPFAPSILAEHISDYFEINDSVPFMEKVFPIKKEKHSEIPAVTHVDGTGRLQTVSEVDNPRYYRLIHRFYEKTNVPILVNTSFNENEPIVNSPEHALECYLRTKMDMLVLGNLLIQRNNPVSKSFEKNLANAQNHALGIQNTEGVKVKNGIAFHKPLALEP